MLQWSRAAYTAEEEVAPPWSPSGGLTGKSPVPPIFAGN